MPRIAEVLVGPELCEQIKKPEYRHKWRLLRFFSWDRDAS